MDMYYTTLPSPVGELLLAGCSDALRVIGFSQGGQARRAEAGWRRDDRSGLLRQAVRELKAYFARAGDGVFTVPLAPDATPFQAQVLAALRDIPCGETRSYGEVAGMIGKPGASRAVGGANALNPIPIIIPCHRVVGSNRMLTGFGGGMPAKRWLLRHEGVVVHRDRVGGTQLDLGGEIAG